MRALDLTAAPAGSICTPAASQPLPYAPPLNFSPPGLGSSGKYLGMRFGGLLGVEGAREAKAQNLGLAFLADGNYRLLALRFQTKEPIRKI